MESINARRVKDNIDKNRLDWKINKDLHKHDKRHNIPVDKGSEKERIDKGFFKKSKKKQTLLSEAVSAIDEQSIKCLPNFKQMVESLKTYRKDYSYTLYKHLSKNVHGVGCNISDFLSCENKFPALLKVKKDPPKERCISCRAMASVIQMNNVKAISSFDKTIGYDDISAIEQIWATLYVLLKAEGM